MERKVTTGTAYEALGFSREEAAVRAMRVVMAAEINKYVKARRMKQSAAADYFGVSQPRISNILNRKLDRFSLDQLVKMAAKTGRVPAVVFRGSAPKAEA